MSMRPGWMTALAAFAALVVAIVAGLPDIKRYLKIRSM
jgi:hypothetical protein